MKLCWMSSFIIYSKPKRYLRRFLAAKFNLIGKIYLTKEHLLSWFRPVQKACGFWKHPCGERESAAGSDSTRIGVWISSELGGLPKYTEGGSFSANLLHVLVQDVHSVGKKRLLGCNVNYFWLHFFLKILCTSVEKLAWNILARRPVARRNMVDSALLD